MNWNNHTTANRYLNLFVFFPLLFILLKWIAMYKDIRNGVITAAFIFLYFILMLVHDHLRISIKSWTTIFVIIYLLYNILMSFVSCIRGYPLTLIFSESANTLIPITLYFIGIKFSETQAYKFENIIILSGIVILITGAYYNLNLNDPYYIRFIENNNPNFSMHGFSIFPRLNSFMGSVICGTWGCVSTALSFRFLEKEKIVKFWIALISGILLGVLTLQRSAMVCVFAIVFFVLVMGIRQKKIRLWIPIVMVCFLILILFIVLYKFPRIYNAIFERLSSISSAVSERNEGWKNAFSNSFFSSIFGYGFATGGQRAIGISATTVNDGNYFKMIYEIGILGILLFIMVIVSTIKHGKNKKFSNIYFALIISFLLQMIGSNILTFQITASFFWYIIGRLNRHDSTGLHDGTAVEL